MVKVSYIIWILRKSTKKLTKGLFWQSYLPFQCKNDDFEVSSSWFLWDFFLCLFGPIKCYRLELTYLLLQLVYGSHLVWLNYTCMCSLAWQSRRIQLYVSIGMTPKKFYRQQPLWVGWPLNPFTCLKYMEYLLHRWWLIYVLIVLNTILFSFPWKWSLPNT